MKPTIIETKLFNLCYLSWMNMGIQTLYISTRLEAKEVCYYNKRGMVFGECVYIKNPQSKTN